MKIFLNSFRFLSLFVFITLVNGLTQNSIGQDIDKDKLLKAAREIINDANTCALITNDIAGQARVRTMDPFPPEDDFTIWLGTNSNSRKVKQIKNDPNVALYYLDKDASGYVVIYGTAELINDKDSKEKWWKEKWEAFYTDKETYLLIKVTPKRIEISSVPRGINSDSVTWQPPIIDFK